MGEKSKMAYRVFISYSHQDRPLAEKVCAVIENSGLEPLWDERFAYGWGFHEQIKMFIAHAHVFLPIITESSSQRGWVHQEIGYALALNIPVLPVAWGKLPDEMLRELHAVVLTDAKENHESELSRKLTLCSVSALLTRYLDDSHALYETAPISEDRALLMARYANQVQQLGRTAMLRQKGGLSSLHIPDLVISHPVWKDRCGGIQKGAFHNRCLRDERIALEHHARKSGFKIIIDPHLTYDAYGPPARKIRLNSLIHFLSSTGNDPKYQVAFCRESGIHESITILGDWFYAESAFASQGSGYRQTIFTRHAPSMKAKIDLFDQEFNSLLDKLDWKAETSKLKAMERLRKIADGASTCPQDATRKTLEELRPSTEKNKKA